MKFKRSKLEEIVNKHLGAGGRMISFSKSAYHHEHPDNIIYFNAQIHNKKRKFIWGGDLDITKDMKILKKIEKESGEVFYVTPELWINEFKKETIKLDSTLKFGGKK